MELVTISGAGYSKEQEGKIKTQFYGDQKKENNVLFIGPRSWWEFGPRFL
jgi:hypothetical protein